MPRKPNIYSEKINAGLVKNWNLIATDGVHDIKRTEIQATMSVSSNCSRISPPKLKPKLQTEIIAEFLGSRNRQFSTWKKFIVAALIVFCRAITGARLKKKEEVFTIDRNPNPTSSTLSAHLEHKWSHPISRKRARSVNPSQATAAGVLVKHRPMEILSKQHSLNNTTSTCWILSARC
ncbi:unnamed protein product [Allacma fusca]|uniref:Uncharacterized protein n=1 Tax=Allacma fusca TaxID=39272 RepID=A0A8J2Q1I9_9HEXA|nr:unnamed protein product [Allacma fusca]